MEAGKRRFKRFALCLRRELARWLAMRGLLRTHDDATHIPDPDKLHATLGAAAIHPDTMFSPRGAHQRRPDGRRKPIGRETGKGSLLRKLQGLWSLTCNASGSDESSSTAPPTNATTHRANQMATTARPWLSAGARLSHPCRRAPPQRSASRRPPSPPSKVSSTRRPTPAASAPS